MKEYKRSEVAKIIGVHPNTIIAYEKAGYISAIERRDNGYRIYLEKHIEQIKLIRLILNNELIKTYMWYKVRDILLVIGKENFQEALTLCEKYLEEINIEKINEYKIIEKIKEVIKEHEENKENVFLKRSEASKIIGVSIDVIINWERSEILSVPRNNKNNYRVYSEKEILILKIIKILREEEYSSQCVRRMINKLQENNFKILNKELLSNIEEKEKDVVVLIKNIEKLINMKVFI